MLRNRKHWYVIVWVMMAALLFGGSAFAAEVTSGDVYRLAAGEVIEDDLVVSGSEIYIDGTVMGDLIAAGGFVEVNGTIEGDAIIAGGEIQINGTVTDDVRVAGGGVTIRGNIGDDLFAAAGGSESGNFPLPINDRQVEQGLRITEKATIGGSVYLGTGMAEIAGTIAEDLEVGAGLLTLDGTVEGDAKIQAGTFNFGPDAHINGRLSYTSPTEVAIPAAVTEDVDFTVLPADQPQAQPSVGNQLLRLVLILLGFTLVGWLLLRFAPDSLRRPAAAIATQPTRASIYGLAALGILFIIPIVSGLLMIAIIVLWGWLPGIMFFLFLTAALVLTWTFSPLITGLWVGQLVLRAAGREANELITLLAGAAIIVILSFIPILGWFISLASLIFAIGGVILNSRQSAQPVGM